MMPGNAEGSAWQHEEVDAADILMRIEEGGLCLAVCMPHARASDL
jgi:hypothetical protein